MSRSTGAHTEFHRTLMSAWGSDVRRGARQSRAEHRRLYLLTKERAVDEASSALAAHLAWPVLTCIGQDAFERLMERVAVTREQPDLILAGMRSVHGLEPVRG